MSKISGGGGGVYRREEYHGGDPELRWPDGEITGCGSNNGERRKQKKEKRRKKEELDQNIMYPKGVSLAGALL
jgi:hypothetical protein